MYREIKIFENTEWGIKVVLVLLVITLISSQNVTSNVLIDNDSKESDTVNATKQRSNKADIAKVNLVADNQKKQEQVYKMEEHKVPNLGVTNTLLSKYFSFVANVPQNADAKNPLNIFDAVVAKLNQSDFTKGFHNRAKSIANLWLISLDTPIRNGGQTPMRWIA